MASDRAVVDRLREVVGAQVIEDPEMIASYTTDWTGRFSGSSKAVVRPGSTDEVAGVVAACRELGVALVPQGGNTGLVGGGVPLHDEVVLSLQRLQTLEPVDPLAGQVTAGAGVTLSSVQHAAGAAGWAYGVDLGARDSATVGGTVATNAGGTHVLRYGNTRAQVIGVEAVLGTGSVISHLGGLVKDNTGYDLPGLLCGSEGTLAVVTAARLRLVPPMPFRTVAVLAFATVAQAVDASVVFRRSLPTLDACELFLLAGLELVCSTTGIAFSVLGTPPGLPAGRVGRSFGSDRGVGRGDRLGGEGDRGGRRHRALPTGRTVALPRRAYRGDQHPGPAPQTRCHPAARVTGRLHRPGPGHGAGHRSRRAAPGCSGTPETAMST